MKQPKTRSTKSATPLRIGSDVEIARAISGKLAHQLGDFVVCESRIWYFASTHWIALPENKLRRLAHSYDGASYGKHGIVKLSQGRINSILNEFMCMHDDTDFFSSPPVGINSLSGFIRFCDASTTPKLEPHSPEHRCRHVIQGSWPAAQSVTYEGSMLSHLFHGCFKGDRDAFDKIKLLGEVAGAVVLGHGTHIKAPKAIVLKGETAENGKSQVLDLFRGLVPESAISAIPLGKLGDEKYVCGLAGKLLNTSDELSSAAAVASDAFKLIVTGEPVSARDVYRSTITFRPQAQHLYATNDLPIFKGGMDRGVQRRLLVLTFNRTIPMSERVEHIGSAIASTEMDLLLAWAVSGAKRLIEQGSFTEPESSKVALRNWLYGADPVLAWLELSAGYDPSAQVAISMAHSAFKIWALEEGYPEDILPPINMFSTRMQNAGKDISYKRTAEGRFFIGLAV